MKLKPYPEYKDSGVEWIGEIPKNWNCSKIKHIADVKISNVDKKSKPSEPDVLLCNYTDVYNNEFIIDNLDFMKATASIEQIKKLSLKKGDVIITKDSEAADDIAVTALVKENVDNVVCGYHLALIRPDVDIKGDYLFRLLESKQINDQFVIAANGVTRFGISTYPIKNSYLMVPSIKEQEKISSFLDKKTSEIDLTIEKDTRLIELLKEKRTALINHVVTKGLDPTVKMKDSGVEWIGRIPDDWDVNRLKFLTAKKAQYGANEEPEYNENKFDYRYVRITDVNDNGGLKKDSYAYLSKENARGFVLEEGDVLFARSGATVGKVYYYSQDDGNCCFAGYMIRYVTNNELLEPQFLLYYSLSKSYKEWIKVVSTQSTIENVSAEKYDELNIPTPKLSQQRQIVKFLDNEIPKIDEIILKIEEKISFLKEYKKSLIHHVVTGKVDVREVAV